MTGVIGGIFALELTALFLAANPRVWCAMIPLLAPLLVPMVLPRTKP